MAEGGMSINQLMQVSAWGLGLGTLFFAFFGQNRPRDFFLTIGLVACIAGDLAFVAFLAENEGGEGAPRADGRRGNETMTTLFVGFALFALYGLASQLWKYKEDGFLDDDEDDDEEVEKQRAAAAEAATAAGRAARPGVAPPEEEQEGLPRRAGKAAALRDAPS